jgi:hypothetical protein
MNIKFILLLTILILAIMFSAFNEFVKHKQIKKELDHIQLQLIKEQIIKYKNTTRI